MRERPILFSAPMIRAILAGTKTQTRRVIKSYQLEASPGWYFTKVRDAQVAGWRDGAPIEAHMGIVTHCPYGGVGDRLWVRETWKPWPNTAGPEHRGTEDMGAIYAATWDKSGGRGWKPSIHMPRWASRITLEITSVQVERVQDISEADARAEGVMKWAAAHCSRAPEDERPPVAYFELLWDSINGERAPWSSDPWVWAISFRRLVP